jgi:spermidine synthase
MLGVAGGTALRTLRHLLPEVSLTGIDLDAELISLAEKEMHLGETGAEIVIADAYEWVKDNRRRFDVIIDDLYLAGDEDVFRADTCDADWLGLLKNSLAPGGILALNLVTGPGHRAKQSATRKNLAARFRRVCALSTENSLNEILVAGDDIATGSRLVECTGAFADWRDRMFWKRIKVRKLK